MASPKLADDGTPKRGRSHLLLDESPVVYQNRTSQIFNDNEARALQQIFYWLQHPYFDKTLNAGMETRNYRGRLYVRIPPRLILNRWRGRLRTFSLSTWKRAITSLKNQGVLLTENLNAERDDTTNWYAVLTEVVDYYDGIYEKFFMQVETEREAARNDDDNILRDITPEREEELYREMEEELERAKKSVGARVAKGQRPLLIDVETITESASVGAPIQNEQAPYSERTGASFGLNPRAVSERTGASFGLTPPYKEVQETIKKGKEHHQHHSPIQVEIGGVSDDDDDDDFLITNGNGNVLRHPNADQLNTPVAAITQSDQQVLVPNLQAVELQSPENAAMAKKLKKLLGGKQAEHFLREVGPEQCGKYLRELELIIEQRERNQGEPILNPGSYLLKLLSEEAATPLADAAEERAGAALLNAERAQIAKANQDTARAESARNRATSEQAAAVRSSALDAAFAELSQTERAEIDTQIVNAAPILRGRESSAGFAIERRAAVARLQTDAAPETVVENTAPEPSQAETLARAALGGMVNATPGVGALNRGEIYRVLGQVQKRLDAGADERDVDDWRDSLGADLEDDEWEIVTAQLMRRAA